LGRCRFPDCANEVEIVEIAFGESDGNDGLSRTWCRCLADVDSDDESISCFEQGGLVVQDGKDDAFGPVSSESGNLLRPQGQDCLKIRNPPETGRRRGNRSDLTWIGHVEKTSQMKSVDGVAQQGSSLEGDFLADVSLMSR